MDDYKTEGRLILDRVLAEPQDDMHRLAYADWSMERGDERADRGRFIQLQIEYHNLVNAGVPHLDPGQINGEVRTAVCLGGFDPDDELPKCPLCRARVKLERHLKEAHHRRYVLDGPTVIESLEVATRDGRPSRVAWTWVRGFKKSLTLDRSAWLSTTWRGMDEWGPRSVPWHPIDRVTFTDAHPNCGQCRHIHWGCLAPHDSHAAAAGPAAWQQNVLPTDLWAGLEPHRDGEFYPPAVPRHRLIDYSRGWYPPYGSAEHDELNGPLGSDARGELERRYAEQAQADLSQAAIKAMRKLAEASQESEESSPAGVDS